MVKKYKKDYNLTFIFGIIYIVFENPVKLFFARKKLKKLILKKLNDIPPYYIMYPGRDKSVALKDSVLSPQFPKYKK